MGSKIFFGNFKKSLLSHYADYMSAFQRAFFSWTHVRFFFSFFLYFVYDEIININISKYLIIFYTRNMRTHSESP